MELGKQIKMHRQEAHLSQEELANRVYVSRQTISNWENDKSYPDVNSLVLLSEIFQISLDNLIKGDIEVMKDVIQKEEIEKMNRYGKSYTIMLIATAVSAVPLFMWLGVWPFIHCAGYILIHLFQSLQTYIEILKQLLCLRGCIFLESNKVCLLAVDVICDTLDRLLYRVRKGRDSTCKE